MPEPKYEPENQTECAYTESKIHQWFWDEDKQDWQCDECGIMQEHQED